MFFQNSVLSSSFPAVSFALWGSGGVREAGHNSRADNSFVALSLMRSGVLCPSLPLDMFLTSLLLKLYQRERETSDLIWLTELTRVEQFENDSQWHQPNKVIFSIIHLCTYSFCFYLLCHVGLWLWALFLLKCCSIIPPHCLLLSDSHVCRVLFPAQSILITFPEIYWAL